MEEMNRLGSNMAFEWEDSGSIKKMLNIESGISPENALQEIFLSYKVYPNLHHIDIVITNSEPQQTLYLSEFNPQKQTMLEEYA